MLDFILQLIAALLLATGEGRGCEGIQPVAIYHEDGSAVVGAECLPDPRYPDETPYVVFVRDAETGTYTLDTY